MKEINSQATSAYTCSQIAKRHKDAPLPRSNYAKSSARSIPSEIPLILAQISADDMSDRPNGFS